MYPEELYYERIAKVCHEANRAYCESVGDMSQINWDSAPQWQKDSTIAGVKWRIKNMDAPYSAQHEQWLTDKLNDGWVYGETKDAEKKTHPCIVLWTDLPYDQKLKDILFTNIVRALA